MGREGQEFQEGEGGSREREREREQGNLDVADDGARNVIQEFHTHLPPWTGVRGRDQRRACDSSSTTSSSSSSSSGRQRLPPRGDALLCRHAYHQRPCRGTSPRTRNKLINCTRF